MRVLSRGWVLVVMAVLAGLLVAPTPAAAADDVYLLAPAGDTSTPQYLRPLVQTAAGMVYGNEYSGTTWVKLPGLAHYAQQEDRLSDPAVVGDVLSDYDAGSRTLRWRTIADETLHETVLPPELTYLTRTATGYLAREGAGPSQLVAVDLLGGDARTVIGSFPQADDVLAGPLGAAVPVPDVPGEWSYHPYDGSATGGRPVQVPPDAETCHLASDDLHCWSATELTRAPLTGADSATVAASPRSLVETAGGVAFTTPDPRYPTTAWHQVWVWRAGEGTPVRAVNGEQRLTAELAPVTDGSAVALAAKVGSLSEAGLYRISNTFTVSLQIGTRPQPRTASTIAVGPGRVAWSDNSQPGGTIMGRNLSVSSDGGLVLNPTGTLGYGADGTALGVSGWRAAYAQTSGGGLVLTGVSGDPQFDDTGTISATVSGQRVVRLSRDADGVLGWRLTDLTSTTTTPLPDALSYDLWGERLARLDADGSVWLHDLRTSAAPVQIAPALAGGADEGTVHLAGDVVAWDLTPVDADVPDPGVVRRDVDAMTPAEPVPGLSELQDLSTGYAVGCGGDGACAPRAVSLADGTALAVDTERPMAVDGNVLGFLTGDRLPALRILPPYADPPRLLASPDAPAEANFAVRPFRLRVMASQVLTTCQLEIRDVDDVLLRTVPCTSAANGAATVEWSGRGAGAETVEDGTYGWRIVAANGDRPLVDYDRSTSALGGTLTVDSPPRPTVFAPEPGAVAVAQTTEVGLSFDEPVTGVDSTSLQLRRAADGVAVPSSVDYDAPTRTATLTPVDPLSPLSRYSVTTNGGIVDLQGNPVSLPEWSFSTGTTSTANACSLVMPTKVVVAARSVDADVRVATNCSANGAEHAYWDLFHPGRNYGWGLMFEEADLAHPNWYITWRDFDPMGVWTLVPVEAEQADGNPLKQNSAVVKVKYGSRLTTKVTRTRTALSWAVTATQWSGVKHGWNTRARVTVGLFHQPPGSTTWKYVKSVKTSSTGRATVTLGSPKAGNYRLVVGETPTVWAAYSTPIRGRI